MQQNGIKRDDGRGRVSRVSETGIKIEGRENWLSFSKPSSSLVSINFLYLSTGSKFKLQDNFLKQIGHNHMGVRSVSSR
jgi:hypothetical protein